MWGLVVSAGVGQMVRPAYYSQPFIADFIGTTANTRVITLNSCGLRCWFNVIWYLLLARVAIVNFNLWPSSDNAPRPSQTFRLSTLR